MIGSRKKDILFKTKNSKILRSPQVFMQQDLSYKLRDERLKLRHNTNEAWKEGKYAYSHFRYLFIDDRNELEYTKLHRI